MGVVRSRPLDACVVSTQALSVARPRVVRERRRRESLCCFNTNLAGDRYSGAE